jgi:cytochrome b subunit of formate dehydrogenase
VSEERVFPRFVFAQRAQHGLLITAFTALAVTGLSQTYAGTAVGERMIGWFGGIEGVRVGHRAAAVILMITGIWHVLAGAHHIFVLRRPLAILPRASDVGDFWQTLRYNLGRAAERPRMGRFTFEEKVEYWALLWGTLLMVGTGFMLWNPIATTRVLPGQWIPAAQVVHGGEAVLAVLAVLVWHGYGVHLRHFNRSMFTGTMTETEMRHEHPLELERLLAGPPSEKGTEAARRLRVRIFWPLCALVTLALAYGLFWFVTFEETALPVKPSSSTSRTGS